MTSLPSRRHTLPSSRPMTPAPITPSRLGTASKSSAPQESTMFLPSNGAERSSVGLEPDASTTCFAVSSRLLPSCAVIELRGFEQRLRRNTARVQTRAAECRRAIAVFPFIDACDGELVLAGAD